MKKTLVFLLILVLSLSLLAGCGGSSEQPAAQETEEPAEEAEAPAEAAEEPAAETPAEPAKDGESVLRIGDNSQWLGIDNYQLSSSKWSQNFAIETILSLQADGSYGPGLAKSFTLSDDGTLLTLEIPDDIAFPDGTPVTPEDVKASIEHGLEVSPYNTDYDAIESMEVDGQNLICHLSSFSASTLYNMASLHMPVIPAAQLASMSEEELLWGATPYGAYYLASPDDFVEGASVKLTKNPYYKTYNPLVENVTGPDFDYVYIQTFESDSAMLNSLNAGETDLTFDLALYMLPEITEAANVRFNIEPHYTSIWLQMNADDPLLADENVRKALIMLTDRDIIADAAGGMVTASYDLLPIGCIDYSDAASKYFQENYGTNPQEALKLLTEAGWADSNGDGVLDKDGETFTVKMLCDPSTEQLVNLFQIIWGQAGINVEIEEMTSTEPFMDDSYQIGVLGQGWPEPAGFLPYIILDPNLLNEEQYNTYFATLAAAEANQDDAARAEAYAEAQKILLDTLCEIPVATLNDATVISNNLEGGYFGPCARRYLQDMHFVG